MQAGYDGLLCDKTRPSRIRPLGSDIAERVIALTRTDPPVEATHWTASMMAKAVGISATSVQRIWRAHGLQPHRVQQFKLSNDPKFIDKLRDVVGPHGSSPVQAQQQAFRLNRPAGTDAGDTFLAYIVRGACGALVCCRPARAFPAQCEAW